MSAALLLAVVGAAVLRAQVVYDNLLLNGSFERGPRVTSGACQNISSGQTDLSGWRVTRSTVDICQLWRAADGKQSIDLDGNSGDRGGIKQVFRTLPGQSYVVTFHMAGNIGAPKVKELRVEAAGQSRDFSFDITGRSFTDMGWEKHDWAFTAIDRTSAVEFYSLDSKEDCGICNAGPALDNVSIVLAKRPPVLSNKNPRIAP
jgi:choice-of-anchor C domain-containing protein